MIAWNRNITEAPLNEKLLLLIWNRDLNSFYWDTAITKTGKFEFGDGFHFENLDGDQFNSTGHSNRENLSLLGWHNPELPESAITETTEDFNYNLSKAPQETSLVFASVGLKEGNIDRLRATKSIQGTYAALNTDETWDKEGYNKESRLTCWSYCPRIILEES